jgi:3-hydroxybutyryl-CoA dehydrogenase
MAVKKIGVLGAGLMGSGIAQVAAASGYEVTLIDVDQSFVDKGLAGVEKSLAKFVEKGTLSPNDKTAALSRLGGAVSLDALADADLVIEAIIENLQIKKETFARLDELCKAQTIFASNTSSLSITEILVSVSADRRRRFLGMHFFNPVPMMKLVELIRTLVSDPAVYEEAIAWTESLGKTVVRAGDKTGFIVNRLLVPLMLDGVRVLEEGLASIEDIDQAMKLGCNHPMGPLTLTDFVGLDTTYYIANIMYDEFKEKRFAPPPLLKRMVQAGYLGRKSGRGFYDYSDPKNPKPMTL